MGLSRPLLFTPPPVTDRCEPTEANEAVKPEKVLSNDSLTQGVAAGYIDTIAIRFQALHADNSLHS